MLCRAVVWTLAVVLLKSSGASADDISVGGVIDARFISTDTEKAWLDGGLGKSRYGSLDGKRDSLLRLSQLSVFAKGDVAGDLSAQVQLNVDAEPSGPPVATHNPVGLIEGFLTYHPDFSPSVRMRVRAGVFFPPVSMENIGPAWTSP